VAAQPRFHLEMALLRWVHLRKLVPLATLLEGLAGGGAPPPALAPRAVPAAATRPLARPPVGASPAPPPAAAPSRPPVAARPTVASSSKPGPAGAGPAAPPAAPAASEASPSGPRNLLVDDVSEPALARFREAFLAEVKRSRSQADWGMVLMPARRIEVAVGTVTFVYESQPKIIAGQFEKMRPGLSELATTLAGRPMAVSCRIEAGPPVAAPTAAQQGEKDRLKAAVMAEPAVQALLDVFPADIRDVEEVKE
jgi:DNA polymerase-3 subunit gamma/tau